MSFFKKPKDAKNGKKKYMGKKQRGSRRKGVVAQPNSYPSHPSSCHHGSKLRYRSLTRRVPRRISLDVSVWYRAIRKGDGLH